MGVQWRRLEIHNHYNRTSDQKTTVLVRNEAHLSISGNCTTGSDASLFGIFFGGGGYEHPFSSARLHSVGFTGFSSSRGPANLSLAIRTENVLSYMLVVEYDAAAPLNRSTSPSPMQSPSPSASPQEEETEPFPTLAVAAVSGAILAVVGAGLLVYIKKRNLKRDEPLKKPFLVLSQESLTKPFS